ncbi:MAG: thiolase family protein [Proteobacteria bacterium]|nr:thiolase family protein [Pseudomonadota bacterium]
MRDVFVIGAGMTRFGLYDGRRLPSKSVHELGMEACLAALDDSGVNHRRIEAAFSGNVTSAPNCGQMILSLCGISGIPTFNHENACASGSAAFKHAVDSIASGICDLALVVGAECWSFTRAMGSPAAMAGLVAPAPGLNLNQDIAGAFGPALLALVGRAHMAEYGTTPEQLALIAVKNKRNAARNPLAQFQKEVSLIQVLDSRMISDPLTKLQCCPHTDGAAAVILASADAARQGARQPVKIAASAMKSASYKGLEGRLSGLKCFELSARAAYEAAGIGPDDVDVVELHDDFTSVELVAYEDLGLCPRGEAGRFIEEGRSDYGGQVVVNPSGGLLGKGHPLGATGVAQIVELTWQLRGDCGVRQVEGARVGLAHNGGGIGEGFEPGIATITLLTR